MQQGRSDRLPSTVANGSRSITHAPYGETLTFNAQDESSPDHRKLFFSYLGLALKYRWLILVFCGISFSNRVDLNFHVDPDLSGDSHHPDRPTSAKGSQG